MYDNNILKFFYIRFLTITGLVLHFFNSKKKNKIFLFHEISEKNFNKFKQTIKYIKKKYKIIDPKEKFSLRDNSNQAIISFDDGYHSQYLCTKKYLDKKNIKAIFFVIYNFMNIQSLKRRKKFLKNNLKIDNRFLKNKEFKNMSIKNLKLLIKNGHSVGAHTLSHPNLIEISKRNCEKEILKSKHKISKKLGLENIDTFAITFGGIRFISPHILKVCKKYYKSTFTGIRGSNNNRENIYYRDNCDLNKDFNEIKFVIDGHADLHYLFDRFKLKVYNLFSNQW